MNAQLEAKLIECLDALTQGESVDRILARYPDEAAQLRPLLRTAAGLSELRLEPSEAAKIKSRQQFMAQADLLRRTTPRKTMGFLPRFVTGLAAAALVAIVLSTGAVAASGSALPGDPLYGLKRTVEDVRLQSASSPAQHEALQREFEQRRVNETNQLLDAGREGEVEFTGTIEEIQTKAWIVSSLVVQVDANTAIVGTPQINRVAEVHGVTGPGGLRATSISIESSGETDLTPTPEPIETPETTVTPEPTKTTAPATPATPQATRTPQAIGTPQPTPVPSQPTATPQAVEIEFTGSVVAQDPNQWSIDGTLILVDVNTVIQGNVGVGQRVKVTALRFAEGSLRATRIELLNDGGGNNNQGGNNNTNSNNNQNENENSNENGDNHNENHNSNSNENENDSHGGNGNDN
jgi:cell division septation protein DedD